MRLTELAQAAVKGVLREGDQAIDATAGNGHDTLLLAQCVGGAGRVLAIDLQVAALAETQRRLDEALLGAVVRLHGGCHSELDALAERYGVPSPRAMMFNLGYLPGSDKSCTTRGTTTGVALDAASKLLAPGGVLTVLAYRGHKGGAEEADVVDRWWAELNVERFLKEQHDSPQPTGPKLSIVYRRASERFSGRVVDQRG